VFCFLIYGGEDFAASLGWNPTYNLLLSSEYTYSWFIGVIVGALGASITMSFMPRIVYYVLGGLMELISSIIVTAVPSSYEPCLAARYLAGIGIGLITVSFLVQNSEQAANRNRGVCAAMEQVGLTIGVAFQVWFTTQSEDLSLPANLIHGIIGIVASVVGLCLCLLLVESPVFHLQHSHETKACECQKKLSRNPVAITKALEEARAYVAESQKRSLGEDLLNSLVPFFKLVFFRCFVAFSISVPLIQSFVTSTAVSEGSPYAWPTYVWAALRLIGVLFAICLLDTMGRKCVALVGLLCMAGLMLGLAGIYGNMITSYSMAQASNIGMAFQVFAALFVCSSSTYMGEAFPMRLKPFLVGLVVCLEQATHLIVIACMPTLPSKDFFFQYFLAVGIIMLVFLIIFAVTMPETKKRTLRESSQQFQKLFNIRIY
ncbi:hypothetical protein KR018_001368, partial [Drosophila ironensis]